MPRGEGLADDRMLGAEARRLVAGQHAVQFLARLLVRQLAGLHLVLDGLDGGLALDLEVEQAVAGTGARECLVLLLALGGLPALLDLKAGEFLPCDADQLLAETTGSVGHLRVQRGHGGDVAPLGCPVAELAHRDFCHGQPRFPLVFQPLARVYAPLARALAA